jgi:GT2 family glycosyltransferase
VIETGHEALQSADLPEVWCVVPHYGDDALLDRCRESALSADYPPELFGPEQFVVIDNNPPNPNLLFTGAVNEGMRRVLRDRRRLARDSRCLIVVLNNDIVLEPACFRRAVQCFEQEGWSTTGIVGPRNVRMDDPDRIFWGGSLQCFPAGKHKTGLVSRGDLAQRTQEEWITFSAAFLNMTMVEQVGMLDRNLRHIGSDSDYCFRARTQGWRLFYEPQAVVRHAVGTSAGGAPDWLRSVMRQDMEYFASKWLKPGGLFGSLTRYRPVR